MKAAKKPLPHESDQKKEDKKENGNGEEGRESRPDDSSWDQKGNFDVE